MTAPARTLPDNLCPSEDPRRPDFCAGTALTPRTPEPHRRAMIEDMAKSRMLTLSRRWAKAARWHIHVQAYIDGEIPTTDLRKMAGESTIGWMYDDAHAVRQLLTDLGCPSVPGRPRGLYGVGEIIRIGREFLGMRQLTL